MSAKSIIAGSPAIPNVGTLAAHAPQFPGPGSVLGPEIGLSITPRGRVVYSGTAAQLIEEGAIGPDFAWPSGSRMTCWDEGDFTFGLCRCRPDGVSGKQWRESGKDYWRLGVGLLSEKGKGFQAAAIYAAERELLAIRSRDSLKVEVEYRCLQLARNNTRFQSFLLAAGAVKPPKARKARGTK